MTTKDVMIDIETLSTAPDALVLSIGARQFDCVGREGPWFGEALLVVPDLVDQLLMGRRVDRSTQEWWSKQDPQAATHWRTPSKAFTVRTALAELHTFVRDAPRVWARGPHFDIAILDSLYQCYGMKSPWRYNTIRDVRTYCDDRSPIRTLPPIAISDMPPHHPLKDCELQICDLWTHGLGTGDDTPPAPRIRDCDTPTVAPPAMMVR